MAFPVKIQMNKREKPAYCTIYTCAYSSATRVTRTLESKVVNEWKFGLKKMVGYRNTGKHLEIYLALALTSLSIASTI